MLNLLFLGLGSSQCSNDQIVSLMAAYTDLTTCLDNNACEPEEEANRRRLAGEDNAAYGEMPDLGNVFTTFECYCSNCKSDMTEMQSMCTVCPAITFEYDEDNDANAGTYDDGADPKEFDYATYCTLNTIIALEKVDNFCGVFTGVSSGCLQATENLILVEVEKEDSREADENAEEEEEEREVEYVTLEEDLTECWNSLFASSSNTQLNSCGETCGRVGSQACGVEMLMDAENVPNGVGIYGVGCFASACDEDEAGKILEALKDLYTYAQFLEAIDTGEERDSKDSDATDGLDLPEFTQSSWTCTGNGGSGSDMSTMDDVMETIKENSMIGMVVFLFLFLASCCMCGYYYKQTKDLLEEPLCPPWSSGDDSHHQLTEEDGKNYGSSNQTAGVKA